ncbi:serine hydrolase domain-containing protein [Microbacterium sp. A8/3-1]|uniref:Serine hydrolase domain-containing protein n=1 Tax=Microbacterium sp. A8/3-1 TaxID=3160749 RepID=A0AAU7VX60_9MICO
MAGHDPRTRETFHDVCRELGVVGAQLGVLTPEGAELYAFGSARLEPEVELTDRTAIQIGSTTKLFTAVQIMQLVDRGLVDLDAPVSTYVPRLDLGSYRGAAVTQQITPRMLLSMSSGLDNGRYVDTGDERDSVRRATELIAESSLKFPPGTGWGYSNASTNVSGMIIEELSGLPWNEALERELLQPAGLTDTTTALSRQVIGPTSVGFEVADGRATLIDQWILGRGYGPAGSTLTSTAGDLLGFAKIFLGGGIAGNGVRILSDESVREMQRPQATVPNASVADAWGLGPLIREWGGHSVLGHPGGNRSGGSQLDWVLDQGSAVAVLCNVPAVSAVLAERLTRHVFQERFGLPVPDRPEPTSITADAVRDYVGDYVRDEVHTRIESDGLALSATVSTTEEASIYVEPRVQKYTLLPLGGDSFRMRDMDGVDRGPWDSAFARDESGRVAYFLSPFFASRRER